MLQHVFTEAHQLERLPESMIILEDLEEDKHTSIYAHCTSSNMHKCEVMLVSEIFFFFWQEQEHLFSLMAKWFYITWRLIACDIRGSAIVTLCISDLGRPGGTDAKISSLVISGQRLIHFIGLAQSQGKTWSKATWEGAFRNQKCAFTAINQPSLPLPHHIAGRGSAGWTDRFTTVLSKCQTSSTGPLLWMLWAAT